MRTKRKAFTLIEIMIVIAIIAVLAAITIPNYLKARAQGNLTNCKSNLRNLAMTLELYAIENKNAFYPVSLTDPEFLGKVKYYEELPICPATGRTYTYQTVQSPGAFTLWCD